MLLRIIRQAPTGYSCPGAGKRLDDPEDVAFCMVRQARLFAERNNLGLALRSVYRRQEAPAITTVK